MADRPKRILAAGTVTLRDNEGTLEVLLVHRPRYDDWSLPKGKLEADEHLAVCAVRETREEAAVATRLVMPVGEIVYPVSSGVKTVSYWVAHPADAKKHRPNHEVDQIGWFSITAALRQTTYSDEREVIRRAVNLPATTPLILLRHAKATSRSDWDGGADQERPLDPRGRTQADELCALLTAYGIGRVITSRATRCAQTVSPFATARGVAVEARTSLTEEAGALDPAKVTSVVAKATRKAAETGTPTLVCGHRPLLPAMFAGLGIAPRQLAPAAMVVAHVTADAKVAALELHQPLH